MNISWHEPTWGYFPRVNKELKTMVAHTSLLRILFLIAVVLPAGFYFLKTKINNPNLTWGNLILLVVIGGLFMVPFFILIQYLPPQLVVNKKGIHIRGRKRDKYLFTDITSIGIRSLAQNKKSLHWTWKNNQVSCAIGKNIDTAKLKAIIENNSELRVSIQP